MAKKIRKIVALIQVPSWLSYMNNNKMMSEFVFRMSKPIPDTDDPVIVFKTMLRKHFPIDIDANNSLMGVIFKHEIRVINEICMGLVNEPSPYRKSVELLYALDILQAYDYRSELNFMEFIILWLWKFIHKKEELRIGRCKACDKVFFKSSVNKIFCSDKCSGQIRYQKHKEKILALINKKGCNK